MKLPLNWTHYALIATGFASGLVELLSHYQAIGLALPFHMTAAGLLMASGFLGLVSRSILHPVTPEMLSMARQVLDASTNLTPMQIERKVDAVAIERGASPEDLKKSPPVVQEVGGVILPPPPATDPPVAAIPPAAPTPSKMNPAIH